MMWQKITTLIFLLALFIATPVFASTTNGTVDSAYKYAWGENVGWVNCAPTSTGDVYNGLNITNTTVTGYAWSSVGGWINFAPTNGGVVNDGNGVLSGYAWSSQKGWINMAGVSINTTTGKFSGTSGTLGSTAGRINFSCDNCDVRTDWRPTSICTAWTYSSWGSCSGGQQTRTVLTSLPSGCTGGSPVLNQSCSSGGGGGSIPVSSPEPQKPKHVDANNQDLIIDPDQSGKYTKDTDKGQIVVEVPVASVSDKTTFYIETEPLSSNSQYLVLPELQLMNSAFYDIYAKDQAGNFVHSFSPPLIITLPIPINLQKARNLGVYWLNETNNQWVLIPDAVFADNKVVFQVNHLTRFAIFGVIDEEKDEEQSQDESPLKTSLPIPSEDSKNDIEQDLDQENDDDENSKIKDFFDPIIPEFLKKINDAKKQDLLKNEGGELLNNNSDKQPEQRNFSKIPFYFWWILLILIFSIMAYKGHKNKQKDKKFKK